jgi:hypothetical protein
MSLEIGSVLAVVEVLGGASSVSGIRSFRELNLTNQRLHSQMATPNWMRAIGHVVYSASATMKNLALCSLLLISTFPAWAQSSKSWNALISLTVAGEEPLKRRIVSYMDRELRSIPGVTVTDTDPDWTVGVVATTVSGDVVLSVVVAAPIRPLVELLKGKVADKTLKDIADDIAHALDIKMHVIRIGPAANVDKLCKDLIADFDGAILEANRRAVERANEILKTHPK